MLKKFGKTLITILIVATAVSPTFASRHQSTINVDFDKSLVSTSPIFAWEGTVSGDVTGTLRTELLSLRVAGPIWHVEFDFIITAGADSFTARLEGTLNTKTGQVIMNGVVIEAADESLIGAQVHEEGQLIDPVTSRFLGFMRIAPQS